MNNASLNVLESHIKIRLFSYLKEKLGTSEIEIEVSSISTVQDVMKVLEESYADLAQMKPFIRFAINQEYAALQDEIKGGDELALITPVSGG